MLSGVFQQFFAQLSRQQNRTNFALQRDGGAASPNSLHRDVPHLAHSNTCGTDGLHDEGDPLPAQAERSGDQLLVTQPKLEAPIHPSGSLFLCLLMNKSTSANLNLYFRNTKVNWEYAECGRYHGRCDWKGHIGSHNLLQKQ